MLSNPDNKPLLNSQHKAGKVMGWLFKTNQTKKQLVERLVKPYRDDESGQTSECIKHSLIGNHLWTVFEITNAQGEKSRFINLFLLASKRGYGYKDISEKEYPFYFDCPLSLLKLAPVTCEEWRNSVKNYHEQKSKKITFGIGDKIALKGSRVKAVTLTVKLGKDKFLSHDDFGNRWKITRKFLIDAELIQA